ncbi:MAG: FAD-dependent oxidoreductase [Gammaproteobacteria bacterium]|nr:FAD-dependent oxidoreductase [Gammaproteobacteria bacterium]MCP4879431.1 FAD-dependent oxidoreductase [Gammaproteobacteria bacterium]MDP6165414.1 FAD-dependent oxidoreductase [Gammaproteobacteria bacterium]
MAAHFQHLFSPLQIGAVQVKNRIFFSGHDTCLPSSDFVNEALIAYHEARAAGGVGLIVVQVSGVHESARYSSHLLMATDDACISGYAKLAQAVHAHGCKVVGQLFHPGREIMETKDGLQPVSYSASAVPNERFYQMPRPMSVSLIQEVVTGYAEAAMRMQKAGLDGVEVVASHGYLPAQFLSSAVNQRTDQYGADKALFLRQIVAAVREACGPDFALGLRISGDEYDACGLQADEALSAAQALQDELDYISMTAGTSNTYAGAAHIVPPMSVAQDYLQNLASHWKRHLKVPLLVAGRMNQPQKAEMALQAGAMDACGMTRALICDPLMPLKAQGQALDDVRACIACNQACIGHFHKGLPVSCIQYPQSGRELIYGQLTVTKQPRIVHVIGAGPAGMKAALTAAQRGHQVHLYEQTGQLGGQVRLAQLLPHRSEFGGLIGNFERELQRAGVKLHMYQAVSSEQFRQWQQQGDDVLVATGARPFMPVLQAMGDLQVNNAWQVLQGERPSGQHLVVADWRGDWVGLGVAELLAREGYQVTLVTNGLSAGHMLQSYVRDTSVARLYELQVIMIPHFRLFGYDDNTVYGQHTGNDSARTVTHVDGLILCMGHESYDPFADHDDQAVRIGDCLTPRTAEEAILEGLQVGVAI